MFLFNDKTKLQIACNKCVIENGLLSCVTNLLAVKLPIDKYLKISTAEWM